MMDIQDKWKRIFASKNFILIANIILLLYIFIAFLPIPWSIEVGLDRSGTSAISQAAHQQLIFGKDIIFTVGPLGYLTTGAILDDNFLQIITFRGLIYLLLFIISILRIVTLENLIRRVFISISIGLALFISSSGTSTDGISTDYQILLIFLIILSFDRFVKRHSLWLSFAIGAASGFFILTKFTLGIYIFGSSNLFLLVNFIQSLRAKSKVDSFKYIFSIVNFFLGATSIFFVLLMPGRFLEYCVLVAIDVFIAIGVGLSALLIQNLIKRRNEFCRNKLGKVTMYSNNLTIPWLVFYFAYIILLVYTIYSNSYLSLIDYLKNSLELSSGYSSAMSVAGDNNQLVAAISALFVITYLMFLILKEGFLDLSLTLFFIVLLSFKHGFVRQDGHVTYFAAIIPLMTSLIISKISNFYHRKISHYLFIFILLCSFLITQISSPVMVTAKKLMPRHILTNLVYLTDLSKFKLAIDKGGMNNIASIHLPNRVKKLVGDKPIDIIPWEASLAPANHLNWKPRPIFQSYSAYTTILDDRNFDSLSKEPRDYILYQFQSIDGRHPFFDEPKTFNYVFCNYQPSPKIPGFIKIPNLSNIILLEKLQVSRCSPTSPGEHSIISWNTSHSIEAHSKAIILANVKFQYSLAGKIYKNLLRAPAVMMKVDYVDGSQETYRIIPENSENGVIVSHLPKDDNEAMSFFRGQLPTSVKSFSFQTIQRRLYSPKIEIRFSSELLR